MLNDNILPLTAMELVQIRSLNLSKREIAALWGEEVVMEMEAMDVPIWYEHG